jgi:DNA-binding Xre family transcriptional regulator
MIVFAAMKTRVLRVNLATPLRKLLRETNKSTLAKEIGVSTQKLDSMMNDEWMYITRDAIERAADFLNLNTNELFEFVPVDFWSSIERTKKCTFLRGSDGVGNNRAIFKIPRYDDEASGVIKTFLRDFLHDFDDPVFADHNENEEELIKLVKQENCIVIGSPKSNAATEILLSRFFGAAPFDSSQSNRLKIPFGFCWPGNTSIVQRSSLSCSALARHEVGGGSGIALKGGIRIAADYMSSVEDFRNWKTEKGRDCGLIFATNKPFGTNRNVKLIVVAGFSGIGTLAGACALVEDFRYLEPLEGERCVYGVVEGRYSKVAGSTARKFKDFRWRYRKGGHWPIKPDKKRN